MKNILFVLTLLGASLAFAQPSMGLRGDAGNACNACCSAKVSCGCPSGCHKDGKCMNGCTNSCAKASEGCASGCTKGGSCQR